MVVPVFMGFGALIFPSSEPFSSTIFLIGQGGDLCIRDCIESSRSCQDKLLKSFTEFIWSVNITIKATVENTIRLHFEEKDPNGMNILSLLFLHGEIMIMIMQGIFTTFYAQYFHNTTLPSLVSSYLVEFSKLKPERAGSRTQESAMSKI